MNRFIGNPEVRALANVIVAFPKLEDAKRIRNILVKNGFEVARVCTCGSQAIHGADRLGNGIVVCGGRFADMVYEELHSLLPSGFSMLLLASPGVFNGKAQNTAVCLALPLKVHELISTLAMLEELQHREQKRQKAEPRKRSGKDQEVIAYAKGLLMDRNQMTEQDAHRYMQKCSMDSGTGLVETAQKIVSLMNS